jgi:hypothetical protein
MRLVGGNFTFSAVEDVTLTPTIYGKILTGAFSGLSETMRRRSIDTEKDGGIDTNWSASLSKEQLRKRGLGDMIGKVLASRYSNFSCRVNLGNLIKSVAATCRFSEHFAHCLLTSGGSQFNPRHFELQFHELVSLPFDIFAENHGSLQPVSGPCGPCSSVMAYTDCGLT